MSESSKAPDVITFDDFLKVDIRSGTITKAEAVPKSDKLLRLEVWFGGEIGSRVIMAGIAKSYDPTTIVGLRVLAVVNLAPRKMMGVESHGMLLAGSLTEGVALAQCNSVMDGTRIG
jgi:methionyl-tRNA synthetase